MQITISNAAFFAGVGGSLTGASNTTVTNGTVGISASGVGVNVVTVRNTGNGTKYTGVELAVGSADLVGADPIVVYLKDAFVHWDNSVSVGTAKLDWNSPTASQAVKGYGLTLDKTTGTSIGASDAVLGISDFVQIRGGFALTTSTGISAELAGANTAKQYNVTTLGFSDLTVFAGAGPYFETTGSGSSFTVTTRSDATGLLLTGGTRPCAVQAGNCWRSKQLLRSERLGRVHQSPWHRFRRVERI